jgi:hypothetical protein
MMKPKVKLRPERQLSLEQQQKRQAVFELYRDLGAQRSYERLIEMVRPKHGPISKRTLVNWSQQHNWRARIGEYDRDLTTRSRAAGDQGGGNASDQLLNSAAEALQTVMRSNPVVRTPRDAKMLVDAADKAIKLAETLESKRRDPHDAEDAREWSKRYYEQLRNWVRLAKTAAHLAGYQIVDGHLVPEDDTGIVAATGQPRRDVPLGYGAPLHGQDQV